MGILTQLSPGISTRETDLTQFVPNTGMSGGAFCGSYIWGPVLEYTIVSDANSLLKTFGPATETNYQDWFSASNFLSYTGQLNNIRIIDEATALNATVDGTGILVKNEEHFLVVKTTNETEEFVAKYPGAIGNSLKVSMADSSTFAAWAYKEHFDFAPGTTEYATALGTENDEIHVIVIDEDGLFEGVPGAVLEKFAFLSKASDAKSLDSSPIFYGNVINKQSQYIRYLGQPATSLLADNKKVVSVPVTAGGSGYTTATVLFTAAPLGGVTATGTVTLASGVVSAIVITNPGSGYLVAPTATLSGDGTLATLGTVVVADVTTDNWEQNCLTDSGTPRKFASLKLAYVKSFSGGNNGSTPTSSSYIDGWNMMKNVEKVDVSLLFVGAAGGETNSTTVIQYVIDNVVSNRKDCVLFFSPDKSDVLNLLESTQITNVIAKKNAIARSTSYAVMDSGWKLQYDKFADKYRWIPLNADIAGLCASTDANNDPWWSPAGFNRGNIKNVVTLAFNPSKTARDELYKNNINSVVTFSGDGTVLFGDKTLQAKSSAFSFINVRRLFIILEKSISKAARYSLFEFNDVFTRAQFVAMITPYLREVQGRRGIIDFRVVCDESNNTGDVIDRGEFIASIFIKPNRSINYIGLNFVAVRTGVDFSEVAGITL